MHFSIITETKFTLKLHYNMTSAQKPVFSSMCTYLSDNNHTAIVR